MNATKEEKLIPMMEISGTGAATEERIVTIEKKLRDMEALVKGLTQELLDLKSVAMKMSKQTEERSRAELKRVQPGAQEQPAAPGTCCAPAFKHRSHAKGSETVRCTRSASGTGNGHDHAVRRDHEA